MSLEDYIRSGLDRKFRLISTNQGVDNPNLTFISTFEHKQWPIYGVQWHPERISYEFRFNKYMKNVPHTVDAVFVGQHFSNFFVSEARKNNNSYSNLQSELDALVYNYHSVFIGSDPLAIYDQVYLMPALGKQLNVSEVASQFNIERYLS